MTHGRRLTLNSMQALFRLRVLFIVAGVLLGFATTVDAAGFDEQYDVRVGYYNNDSLPDLYVSSPSGAIVVPLDDIPIVIPPVVAPFVLQNSGNGSFAMISTLTAAERASMRAWPKASVDLSLRDVDFNGANDLSISSINTAIGGAFDQILFASRQRGRAPIQITAKNATFQAYHDDLTRWMLDPNYFINVPLKLVSAQPPTPRWFAFVRDPHDYSTIFAQVAACQARYPSNVCGYTAIDPTPNAVDSEDCVRPVRLQDENLQTIVVDPNHDVCQYSAHVYVYIPGSVTVTADTSIYNPDAKETAEIIRMLREDCPSSPLLPPELAHRVEVILGGIYGQNIFNDPGRGPVNTANSVAHPPAPGDGAFNQSDPTFHHYDVQTTLCAVGDTGCTDAHLSDLLRWFSFPSLRLKPVHTQVDGIETVYVWISVLGSWNPDLYVLPGGTVNQHFLASPQFWQGGIQNVTRPTHIVYPGTITRKIKQNGQWLQVFTHGIGINRTFCSNYNQPFDLPVQLIMGISNDVFGAAAFRALDVQMRLQHQDHPTGLPSSSTPGPQKPGFDETYRLTGTAEEI